MNKIKKEKIDSKPLTWKSFMPWTWWPKLPLLAKIGIGIGLGILAGLIFGVWAPKGPMFVDVIGVDGTVTTVESKESVYQFIAWTNTLSGLLFGLLKFAIPIILIGFIAHGIAELGAKAGRMLGVTVGFAYLSTICAGILAWIVSAALLPVILKAVNVPDSFNMNTMAPIFSIEITPIMGSITALIFAFVMGMVAAKQKGSVLYGFTQGMNDMANFAIRKIIIPLLPLLIFTVFVDFASKPGLVDLLKVFGIVYLIIIIMHWTMIVIHYTISGLITKQNPFKLIKNMLPAYFTAIGTQSSAVTLPVTMECAKKNGLSDEVRDFAVPLCANVHLPGSMITITTCAMAVSYITTGELIPVGEFLPFLFVLGLAAVAAPGVPGGAIMVAAGFLVTMLGFDSAASSLMIALYLAQDSFGTAGNVTTDPSIALLVGKAMDSMDKRAAKKGHKTEEEKEVVKAETEGVKNE